MTRLGCRPAAPPAPAAGAPSALSISASSARRLAALAAFSSCFALRVNGSSKSIAKSAFHVHFVHA